MMGMENGKRARKGVTNLANLALHNTMWSAQVEERKKLAS